jgi:lipopolysaccharide biosynthesis protein
MTDADVGMRRPRRLIIYALWDRRGGIEDFVPHALMQLRLHAERIVVVVNGSLTSDGRAKLAGVCDEVLVRENRGYDIWAHKHAIDHLGTGIEEFDEVILTNDTWFGPVRELEPLFERMDRSSADFWGMTDHPREEPNPFTKSGVLPYHLQSYWIAIRRRMLRSDAWAQYWRDLPQMPQYLDAVLTHEALFTERFTANGFVSDVAFPTADYPTTHPALFNPDLLLQDGCPTLKRRPLFHWPPFLDRHAVVGRWTIELVESFGYPIELIWRNLARTVEPRVLNANAAMHEVLPDVDESYDSTKPFRIAALLHIFYPEMTSEMLDLADNLPGRYDLVITTPDLEKAAEITDIVSRRKPRGDVDVRVLASNAGRDQSAFLIGCKDVLLDDRYDLVVKLHSKKTPQDGFNVGRHFKRQQFSNLLGTPGYVANLLALFQREPGLGLVYPPMIHIGYPTMGRGWWSNKPGFAKYCDLLGIRVPLDEISPLAPYGSMYIARPESLRLLVAHDWAYADFGGAEAYQDGGLAHILERMPSYAAGEIGYHTRTVSTTEYLSISYTSMEFNLDHLSATITGDSVDKIMFVRQAGYLGSGRVGDFVRMYFGLHPRVGRLLGWSLEGAVRGKRAVNRLRSRGG